MLPRAWSLEPRGFTEEVLSCDWTAGLTTSVPTRHLHGHVPLSPAVDLLWDSNALVARPGREERSAG